MPYVFAVGDADSTDRAAHALSSSTGDAATASK